MTRNTDKDWLRISEANPYWGVLSVDKFRGADLAPEVLKQFLDSGEIFIANLLALVRKQFSPSFRITRGLDFGCGVGRCLIPMAGLADEVVGVDVAPRMLDLAERNLAAAGVTNATLVVGDDELSGLTGKFEFINSFIVFQHIPPERGLPIIRRLLDLLTIGGVFSFQATYAKERRYFSNNAPAANYFRRNGNMLVDLDATPSDLPEGTVSMFDYDLNELMVIIQKVAGEPLIVLPTNHDGHIGVHIIGMKARAAG